MKSHYIPQYDEYLFDKIAVDADRALIERHKMDVCRKRLKLFKEIGDLKHKPYLTIEEKDLLKKDIAEYDRLMLCGDARNEIK